MHEIAENESNLLARLESLRIRTPARILVGRAHSAYRTSTSLDLRRDHAAARDAVHSTLELGDLGRDLIEQFQLFEIQTRARTKAEFLVRPDLGRRLDDESRGIIQENCPRDIDLQIALGDGLSATAVLAQVPRILPQLLAGALRRGWRFGRPFVIRHCRVGVLNDIGDLLNPKVAILLIGERPGLATDESLSAYMAYQPQPGHTDAQRNLISNIHRHGVGSEEAARRIFALAEQMIGASASGVTVKEELPAFPSP